MSIKVFMSVCLQFFQLFKKMFKSYNFYLLSFLPPQLATQWSKMIQTPNRIDYAGVLHRSKDVVPSSYYDGLSSNRSWVGRGLKQLIQALACNMIKELKYKAGEKLPNRNRSPGFKSRKDRSLYMRLYCDSLSVSSVCTIIIVLLVCFLFSSIYCRPYNTLA